MTIAERLHRAARELEAVRSMVAVAMPSEEAVPLGAGSPAQKAGIEALVRLDLLCEMALGYIRSAQRIAREDAGT